MTTHTLPPVSRTVHRTRLALAIVAGVALGSTVATVNHSVISVPAPATVSTVSPAALVSSLSPCATEDSRDCYWLASEHGNRSGRSFIDVGGETIYLDGLDK